MTARWIASSATAQVMPDFMIGDLAVCLQVALISCDDDGARVLAEDVPWQRYADVTAHRQRLAAWMRRAMAMLATRLDEIPEGTAIDGKEVNRRLHDAALMGIQTVLADPVLSPLIPADDRQDIEEGLRSMDEVMEAVERGMAGGGEMICPECGGIMAVLFTSIECPSCGAQPVRS